MSSAVGFKLFRLAHDAFMCGLFGRYSKVLGRYHNNQPVSVNIGQRLTMFTGDDDGRVANIELSGRRRRRPDVNITRNTRTRGYVIR